MGGRGLPLPGKRRDRFALIAWPVVYGETGVTFIVNQAGIVYEKELGTRTGAIVERSSFNPDKSWKLSEE